VLKTISKWLLNLHGWKIGNGLPENLRKCVVTAAPHTSNWDFYFTRLAFFVLDIPLRFTVKSSMVQPPLSWLSIPLGAIAIKRDKTSTEANRKSYIDLMAEIIQDNDPIALIITPEGTRSKRTEWKSGFYYLAKKAQVPIALGYLDFEKKIAGIGKIIEPSDNIENDMKELMAFYKNIPAKHPELFAVDHRYD